MTKPVSQPKRSPASCPGTEYVWTENRHVDEETGREAYALSCIGRGGGVHAVLTMSLWAEDLDWVRRIWDVVLDTLEVGGEYDMSGRHPRRN